MLTESWMKTSFSHGQGAQLPPPGSGLLNHTEHAVGRQAAAVHTEKSRQPLNGPCGAGLHTFQACMKAPLHPWAYTCSVTSMLMSRCVNQPWPKAPFPGSHEAQEHVSLQPSHPEITPLPGPSACRVQGWPTVPGGDLELLNVFMRSGCHLKSPTGDNSQPRESREHQPGPRAPPSNSHTALPWNCRLSQGGPSLPATLAPLQEGNTPRRSLPETSQHPRVSSENWKGHWQTEL